MKYDKMTSEQLLIYIKTMDENREKLIVSRDRLIKETRELQERKEILSWDEIASAVAYPKAASDSEKISGGNPDDYKLLHQAERISRIYRSQMEELFEELEDVELQLTKMQFVNRCISQLEQKDKEIIDQFTRKNLSFAEGAEVLHLVRSTIYRAQKHAIDNLTVIYNANNR